MDDPLVSLSITHVNYNPNDRFSYISAWLALVPQGLFIVYATLIWSTREAEVILMFIGQMGCELCNAVLKRYIKEERPTQILGKGYGMPSSHAQFVAFFSVYLSLFLLLRHQPHATQTHTPLSIIERLLVSAAALGSAAAVAASRIYLNYHTPKQVLYGCGIGASLAVAWFIVTSVIRNTGILDQLLDLKIARMCRVRDLVISEDIMDAGWLRWDERRRKRHVE